MFNQIFESNKGLHDRFGLPHPIPASARRRFLEEVGELLEASALNEADPVGISERHIVDEAADVIYTITGLLRAHGLTADDLTEAMRKICASNDAKTTDTHWLVKGKITRKE